MAKVLVTGATGFIGGHLARQLVEKGDTVRVLVRETSDTAELDELGVEKAIGDILDPSSLTKALKGCDGCYHLAGVISTLPRDKNKMYDINYTGAVNVFEACKKAGIERLLYLASIFALGQGEPADEKVEYNLRKLPVPYFKAKRKAELAAWAEAEKGLPIVFVYPTFCVGPGDKYISSSQAIVSFLRRELPVYPVGGINVMDARDAAKGLILGYEKGEVGEQYIVGNKDLTFREMFGILEEITGLPGPKIPVPPAVTKLAGRLAQTFMDKPPLDYQQALLMKYKWFYDWSKAEKQLGFAPRPIEESLADACEWFWANKYARRPHGK